MRSSRPGRLSRPGPALLALLALVLLALVLLAPPAAAQVPADSLRNLSIEEAVARALDRSETVGIARAGVLDARGRQSQARSGYFPQIGASAGYTRTLASQFGGLQAEESDTAAPAPTSCEEFVPNPALPPDQRIAELEAAVECLSTVNPFAAFSDLPFGRENQWSLGLSLSQNLFTGGRVRAQNRIAGAVRRSAEIELDAQEAQALLDVVQAYYDAALAERLVAIADTSLIQAERTLRETRLAFEVGTVAEFDLLRAQVARDNLRPTLIQRTADRRVAALRLKQLLDLPLTDSLVLTTTLGDTVEADTVLAPEPLPPTIEAAAAEAAAVEERAAVRQAEEAVIASEGARTVAGSQRWPTVTLSSQYARLGFPEDVFPDAWNQFVDDWTISVTASLPLFTGGRIKGDRMIAEAGLDQARLRLQQTRELAGIDEETTRAQLAAAEAAWEASTGTVAQARRAYEIAEVRFREGISTQTELTESRLLLQQARANRALAARDLQVARTRMALLPELPLGVAAGRTSGQAAGTPAASAATPATQSGTGTSAGQRSTSTTGLR